MKNDNLLKTLGKAISLSLKLKSKVSIMISILGFGVAFIPAMIARQLQLLTDTLQQVDTSHVFLTDTVKILLFLAVLFILQSVHSCAQALCIKIDGIHTTQYLKEYLLKLKCTVKYRYIENDDRFKERVVMAESGDGCTKAAESIQILIVLLQRVVTFCSIINL